MRPVNLSRKLVLEEAAHLPDGAGGFSEVWAALGEIWADVEARTGRERGDGALSVSTVPYRITVRSAPPGAASRPKPDQRFREGARLFRIAAVAERDRTGRYLTCFATEEAPA